MLVGRTASAILPSSSDVDRRDRHFIAGMEAIHCDRWPIQTWMLFDCPTFRQ